ncbi:MAG TPA: ribonuclease PH [Nostoc sp. UBA8866]|nr:ribonuclease PH [Nostoc sp. UBA8866]
MMLRVSKVKKGGCQKLGIVLLEAGNVMMKP